MISRDIHFMLNKMAASIDKTSVIVKDEIVEKDIIVAEIENSKVATIKEELIVKDEIVEKEIIGKEIEKSKVSSIKEEVIVKEEIVQKEIEGDWKVKGDWTSHSHPPSISVQ